MPMLGRPFSLKKQIFSSIASGSFSFSRYDKQSVGITSNPVPGQRIIPASSASLFLLSAYTNTSISPVISI